MKKKIIRITIAIVLILCVAGLGTIYYFKTRFIFNADGAVGNTAGNLNNGGLFCEYNEKIYFSNPYDNGELYVMDSDCSHAKKLNSSTVASLNVCGSYIYYAKNTYSRNSMMSNDRIRRYGMYRTDLNGKNAVTLYNTLSGISSLYGNYLYYQHYTDKEPLSFHCVRIDGKEDSKLSSIPINPSSVYNGKIYYADPNNGNVITSYNTQNGAFNVEFKANAYLVDAADHYIYYIDLDKHYALVRLNTSNRTVELLYQHDGGKIIRFNRYGSKIFFIVEGENAGLYRMNIDGTQIESIAAGNISTVHCTSQYSFFQYYEDEVTLYRLPTTGVITKIEEITIQKQQ